ncbi:MAG: hypothetical protein B7Y45_00435 [Sphingomonas sp. 28-66-16]|nr:MAG: hypothetical protein B7Y45_00435 [Sphingomonas sp. 28-66-16]
MPSAKPAPRFATWLLLGAAAVLLVSIAYAVSRGGAAPDAKTAAIPTATEPPSTPASIEARRARTRAAPGDSRAWQALGEAEFAQGAFGDAAAAFDRATRLSPDRAVLWSALGEALVMANPRDPMPAPALVAFRKALSIDPKDPRSRYFAAVARDLKGDHRGAIDDWFALLDDTPADAPWDNDLRRTIMQVARINKIDIAARMAAARPATPHPPLAPGFAPGAAIPGPDADQMRAAGALPPSQQAAMIAAMVDRLETKLRADPANVDGWVMLMRSRMTMGDRAQASAALKAAIAANPAARARLEAAAASLQVPAR